MAVHGLTIGVDEVGRGALAGPVVVVAAAITKQSLQRTSALGTLKDSKKLSVKQREAWCAYFLSHPKIKFAIARVYPREIERRNISQAANLAAFRAYTRLLKKIKEGNVNLHFRQNKTGVFLDGGLFLKNKKWQKANVPGAKTIIKADETIPAVSVASIIAKVHRDKFMRKLAKQYSAYGFEIHKGYGTAAHRAALAKHGPCEIHRLTFLKKQTRM